MQTQTVTDYPDINFWDKETPTLEMVNAVDFHKGPLLEKLGLIKSPLVNSFGSTDFNEVIKRQAIVRFLMNRSGTRETILDWNSSDCKIPRTGQHYLDYYSAGVEKTDFWKKIRSFLSIVGPNIEIEEDQVPKEIKDFHSFVKNSYQEALDREVVFTDMLCEEIQKTTKIAGKLSLKKQVDFRSNSIEISSSEVFGYKKYAFGLSEKGRQIYKPSWVEKPLAKVLGINFIAGRLVKFINKQRQKNAYRGLTISYLPESIEKSIIDFVDSKLSFPRLSVGKYANIDLYFSYTEEGLRIFLMNFGVSDFQYNKDYEGSFEGDVLAEINDNFQGLSSIRKFFLKRNTRKFSRSVNARRDKLPFYLGVSEFAKKFNLTTTGHLIYSSEVENEFRWYALERIHEQNLFTEEFLDVQIYRRYINTKLVELQEVANVVENLKQKSLEWNLPLSLPTIVNNKHMIGFESLYPVHLIGRKNTKNSTSENVLLEGSDLKALTDLPILNGQMLSLTGQNAGGKTVTEETYINTVYLAQSGLPVFGQALTMNLKKVIAMVFMERGDGSTLQILLEKVDKVLETVSRSDKKDVLVVIDELGTGTQESLGLATGKKILKKLSDSGVSVLFSTQITELAEYAENKLNTLSYKFDIDYNITEGIGAGGVENLIKTLDLKHL
jgi:hypothetical protein